MRHFFTPGIRDMLLAGFLFSLMTVLVKYLDRLPVMELVFFRSLVSYAISFVLIRKQGLHPWGSHKGWLILRGVAGTVALFTFFLTVKHLPLATAVTLQYLSPIFTSVLAISMSNERMRPLQWACFLLSFAGIVVMKGFSADISLFYLLIGILSSVFSGLAYNTIGKLRYTDHPLVIVSYFPLVAVPVAGLWCLVEWKTPQGLEWPLLLLVGVITQYGQFYMTRAYQREQVTRVSMITYVGIIYAVGFGYFLFAEALTLPVFLGIGLVLAGVLLHLRLAHKPKTAPQQTNA